MKRSPILNLIEIEYRHQGRYLGLDPSQTVAFYTALTQQVSVIQGPPGTGKTYLGLRIVETLLKNNATQSAPILVICYTNHALDQFLEGILKFTRKIVRIGSQSKCAALEAYSLKALKEKSGRRSNTDTRTWSIEIRNELRQLDK